MGLFWIVFGPWKLETKCGLLTIVDLENLAMKKKIKGQGIRSSNPNYGHPNHIQTRLM